MRKCVCVVITVLVTYMRVMLGNNFDTGVGVCIVICTVWHLHYVLKLIRKGIDQFRSVRVSKTSLA